MAFGKGTLYCFQSLRFGDVKNWLVWKEVNSRTKKVASHDHDRPQRNRINKTHGLWPDPRKRTGYKIFKTWYSEHGDVLFTKRSESQPSDVSNRV